MRLIEKQMLKAINTGSNWAKDNTRVECISDYADVLLHGHHIATVHLPSGEVNVNRRTLANWPTTTTKSRLRALGVNVYTRKHITYVDNVAV